jgi:hypothetical protein
MDALVKSVFTAPLTTLFIVAGMLFLLIAVVGNISGKIEPGEKARLISGVVGLVFISVGLAMHILQKTPGVSESPVISSPQTKSDPVESAPQKSIPGSPIPKQEPISGGQPTQKKEALHAPIQTRFDGVVASVVRFEKSGELVMLQLMARNTSRQLRQVCFYPRMTNLIHEATGESWQPKEYAGQECNPIEANKSGQIWMKFDVSKPENKTFSLSTPLFNGTLDNLVLAEPS